jgi:hypothetical protein
VVGDLRPEKPLRLSDYEILTTDIRYAVPTLDFVTSATQERMLSAAVTRLLGDGHHRAVEVYSKGALMFRLSPIDAAASPMSEPTPAA